MLTFIVLPHCGIRSQTLLPDTTPSHIILTPGQPVLAYMYLENLSAKRGNRLQQVTIFLVAILNNVSCQRIIKLNPLGSFVAQSSSTPHIKLETM